MSDDQDYLRDDPSLPGHHATRHPLDRRGVPGFEEDPDPDLDDDASLMVDPTDGKIVPFEGLYPHAVGFADAAAAQEEHARADRDPGL